MSSLTRRDLLAGGAALAATMLPADCRALLRSGAATRPYVDAALGAERWIRRSAMRGASGVTWPADPADPGSVQQTLYSGSPGVVLFYLELHHATGDPRWLAEARAGADYLAATLPASPDALGDEGAGLYTGVAGVAYVLEMVHRATGEARHRAAGARGLVLLRESLTASAAGAEWNPSTDIISGSAGILLTVAWFDRFGGAWDGWWADAARVGDRLLELAIPERGGLKWAISSDMPRRYPNFAHGTAGVSYALTTLAEATGEARFLEGALAGERYLSAIASRTMNDGVRIFHSEPGREQLFYLSWCHGPAGTARLYRRLAVVTREARWREMLPRLGQAIVDGGVPERHPDLSGYWNNISQCCGNCGVVEFFLALHAWTGDAGSLAFAQRVMDHAVARATAEGDGLKWIQAEHRVRPELLVAQTGLMQGAAGVGIAALHLDGALEGRSPLVVLPDAPGM